MAAEAKPGLRERKKQRTREQIVVAARALFTERGFEATSVADIAEASDIAVSTFFGYFPSKVDVLFAGYDEVLDDYIATLQDRPADETAIQATVRWHQGRRARREAVADDSPEARELDWQTRELRGILADDPVLQAFFRQRYGRAETSLAEEVARDLGDDPSDLRPQLIASMKVSMLATFFRIASTGDLSRDDAAAAGSYVEACLTAAVAAIGDVPVPAGRLAASQTAT